MGPEEGEVGVWDRPCRDNLAERGQLVGRRICVRARVVPELRLVVLVELLDLRVAQRGDLRIQGGVQH